MRARALKAVIGTLAVALASGGPALAQVRLAAFRSDMSAADFTAAVNAQTLRDQAECKVATAHDGSDTLTVNANAPSLAGALIAGVVAGAVASAIEASRDDGRDTPGMRACMGRHGYKPLRLTAAQNAELHALHGDDRDKWWKRTTRFAPADGSETYAVLMWDAQENRPVSVHRDPATGDYVRTWTFNR